MSQNPLIHFQKEIKKAKEESEKLEERALVPYIESFPVPYSDIRRFVSSFRMELEPNAFSDHDALKRTCENFTWGLLDSFAKEIIEKEGIIGLFKEAPRLVRVAAFELCQFCKEGYHVEE